MSHKQNPEFEKLAKRLAKVPLKHFITVMDCAYEVLLQQGDMFGDFDMLAGANNDPIEYRKEQDITTHSRFTLRNFKEFVIKMDEHFIPIEYATLQNAILESIFDQMIKDYLHGMMDWKRWKKRIADAEREDMKNDHPVST